MRWSPALPFILCGLATMALAGPRSDRRAEAAWLSASCDRGRIPADLRVVRGVLPSLAGAAPTPGPAVMSGPRLVVEWTPERVLIDGLPVRPEAFREALASAWAQKTSDGSNSAHVVVLGASELSPSRWQPLWDSIVSLRGGRRWIALEVASPRTAPPPPMPDVVQRLLDGRAAIRAQVTDPYSRLSALEDLAVRVGVPRGDCAGVTAVLRDPLPAGASCEAHVRDAVRALDGCALRSAERDIAATAIGDRWAPADRAQLQLFEVTDGLPPDPTLPFGVAIAPLLPPASR